MANKNMIIALVLSFIWSPIFGMVVFIVWIYSIYATYKQVKVVNGE